MSAADAHARIAEASGRKNNDTARILAFVAIRDGEAWRDHRLPEMGRALDAALDEIDALDAANERLTRERANLIENNRALSRSAIGNRDGRKAAEADNERLRAALTRATYLAEHLLQMIDKETWRAQGAEWMGQYEGDFWAEQTAVEIRELAALAGGADEDVPHPDEVLKDAQLISEALDLGLQAWRTTESRHRFTGAVGALGRLRVRAALAGGVGDTAAQAEIERLQALLVEHHKVGVMTGVMIGDRCPICAKVSG